MTTRERRRQARALWEKASRTMDCTFVGGTTSPAKCSAPLDERFTADQMGTFQCAHETSASAILDGLDVKDLP